MATKRTTSKKPAKATTGKGSTKKRVKRSTLAADDPPIIVGGGGSEIIKIRTDLSVTSMPAAGGYNRWRVGGVNIRFVDVDGSGHGVNPTTNSVRFLERTPIKRAK